MDILTIGHTTIDLYKKIKGTSVTETESKMCFFHGSKILVEELEISPGGNALNVAIGVSRLGIKSGIYSELGDDAFTYSIIKKLRENGVNTNFCFVNKGKKNNLSTIIIYQDDRTIFTYHEPQNYTFCNWKKPKIIYYTSMPEGYKNFHKDLILYIKDNPSALLAFNPGSVQLSEGLETFRDVLKVTDILFVNKEEAISLTQEKELEDLHNHLASFGPKLTVITDGKRGASAKTIGVFEKVKIYSDKRPLVDKTGAGDAFSSGFLSAIFLKKTLKEALTWGAVNSGCIVKEIGATKGLLSKKQMISIVKKLV